MIEKIGESVKAVIHSDGKILLQLRDEKPIDALKKRVIRRNLVGHQRCKTLV